MAENGLFRVEVSVKSGFPDPRGKALLTDIRDLGIGTVNQVRVSNVYLLEGKLSREEVNIICRELLADPVIEECSIGVTPPALEDENTHAIEVAYNPGVMDPVEDSVKKGILDLGITTVESVKTAKRYYLSGKLSASDVELIGNKLLVNSVIQHVVTSRKRISLPSATYLFSLKQVDLLTMDDNGLSRLSQEKLGLNLNELKHIQSYFFKLGRNPTDVELETLAQTWSEHCKHKTFKSKIRLDGQVINNLLKSTIMKVTSELNKPW